MLTCRLQGHQRRSPMRASGRLLPHADRLDPTCCRRHRPSSTTGLGAKTQDPQSLHERRYGARLGGIQENDRHPCCCVNDWPGGAKVRPFGVAAQRRAREEGYVWTIPIRRAPKTFQRFFWEKILSA